MKKIKLLIISFLVLALLSGCTTNTPNESGKDKVNEEQEKEPIVTKEIPETFPKDLVPLYDVDEVEGVIAVGEDYHQAYYFSNSTREDLLEKYKEFFKDKEVQYFENDYSYELSGNVDGHKIRMYIMPYNEEDQNAVTTNSQIEASDQLQSSSPITEEVGLEKRYNSTVIIFIYID
ncbi:hypothetical protein E9840_05490 [Tissierella creatinini]|nr:hypothetical protein E9840_05490 [Tissierella creatinini]TJX65280.1 hypothetical protein E8P77_10505 [Soehngenia saccharolytica]